MRSLSPKQTLDLLALLGQFREIERFKDQVFWRDYQRKNFESNAEHTWRLCLLFMVMADRLSKKVDQLKVLKMLLIHDLPEIVAGDTSPLGGDGCGLEDVDRQNKVETEKKAAELIFSKFSQPLGSELHSLWREYEENETNEAKVAKALDKLEGKIQALEYLKEEPGVFKQHTKFSTTYGVEYFEVDPVIKDLADEVIRQLESLPTLD